ncbi:MAG: prepilin peptidase [Lachnospiraceae bacterium]|nr:prepilin peptidase [Lachnospiraceae bacterium]
MIYLWFVLIALASVCGIAVVSGRKGVIDLGEKIRIYKPCEDDIVPYRGKKLILITIICFALALAMQISLYKNTEMMNFIKLYGLFLIVMCAGIIDAKRKIIPNILIFAGLIFRVGIYVYEIFLAKDMKQIIINDAIGFVIGFVLLAVVSLVSKGGLGFGDAKLFGVIGIISGAYCTYSTLLMSLILSTIISLIGIATKRMNRKDAYPFGPCIAAGYIIAVLLTSY